MCVAPREDRATVPGCGRARSVASLRNSGRRSTDRDMISQNRLDGRCIRDRAVHACQKRAIEVNCTHPFNDDKRFEIAAVRLSSARLYLYQNLLTVGRCKLQIGAVRPQLCNCGDLVTYHRVIATRLQLTCEIWLARDELGQNSKTGSIESIDEASL